MNIKSVYVHIPFCRNICSYCDFCKMYYGSTFVNDYLEALKKEINVYYKKEVLNTLYLGGGTPSCLQKDELTKLFEILNVFKFNKKYEFTFECNIEDINEDLLKILVSNRVNRISIGIQTFNEEFQNLLERKMTNINEKINIVKKYFTNINVDLMYGFKHQRTEDFDKDLDLFLKLDVSHISAYCLILEDNTKLKVEGYCELSDSYQRRFYDHLKRVLKRNNYIHYEISNFCKKGYESKHNLTYWNNEEYYGFGLGASGFVNNIRYTNTRSLNAYLKGNYHFEEEVMTKQIMMENELILGLRKVKGISKKKFYKKYKEYIEEVFDTKHLKQNKYYYFIPYKFLFISNYILSDFINIK